MLGAQLGPAEQPVLSAHWDYPQGALKVVCIDRYLRVVQIHRQADPALADICERTKEGAARKESLLVELLVDPGEEAFEDRFRLFLTTRDLMTEVIYRTTAGRGCCVTCRVLDCLQVPVRHPQLPFGLQACVVQARLRARTRRSAPSTNADTAPISTYLPVSTIAIPEMPSQASSGATRGRQQGMQTARAATTALADMPALIFLFSMFSPIG
jgi:hypothetical protein